MKTVMALFFCIAFVCFFSMNATAQTEITLQDADYELAVALPSASVSAAGVQTIPLNDPLTLKRNGKCYVIRCQEGPGCDKCTLLWKDQNGNGKINPKLELRCKCATDPKKECKVQAKVAECKD